MLKLWKEYSFDGKDQLFFKIGPLCLWIIKKSHEIKIYSHNSLAESDRQCIYSDSEIHEIHPQAVFQRIFLPNEIHQFKLVPLIPPKDIIFRPESPILLPSGKDMFLYVNTPFWLGMMVSNKIIFSTPIMKLKETYLGPITEDGEILLAAKTRGVIDPNEIIIYPYRYICRINLHNNYSEIVPIERIRMLCDYLNVYGTKDDEYYSDEVELTISETKEIKIKTTIPTSSKIKHLDKIIEAKDQHPHFIFRAFSSILS